MKICAICKAKWRGDPSVCPLDGGALEELPDPLLGRTIAGTYVIIERIGAGGMGTVYRARNEAVQRDVAIKFLSPELALDRTNRERFLREARAANRIDHEHIIDINDFGESDDGLVYLVMEYLDGASLAQVIARGKLEPRRAIDIAMQIASALARAHELDVIHRDIKPANVILMRRDDGTDFVKLLDFGLAKMKGEIQLTVTGTVFGTPEYMAPEQARGSALGEQADLYSLGCVLYEMIAGRPPFVGALPDLILHHMREIPEKPSHYTPSIPPILDALVMRLLQKDPQQRFADAHHTLEEMRLVANQLPAAQAWAPMPKRERFEDDGPATLTADTWEDRVSSFNRLAQLAHPEGAPSWLSKSLRELAGWSRELASVRRDLSRAAENVLRLEEDVRNGRLRIGLALDVLAEDESRAARRAAQLEAELEQAMTGASQIEPSLRQALRRVDTSQEKLSERDVRAAVELATSWLGGRDVSLALKAELERSAQERDDICFQIEQLKGRLGTTTAEGELELGVQREKIARLDATAQQLLDRVAGRAEEIVKHLLTFPALADEVRAG